ncbi:DUF5123 domain-containing protein [Paraflavisolibacter sp. H34]|uniref:DUF5123 domain-containing protein n=1 Tax=Huijunlia imazamoxiresistens TaxID=3127457 RepID=UPI003019D310
MHSKNIYNILFPVLATGIIASGIASCKKANDWEQDQSYNRLFRPTELTATVDGVTPTIRWKTTPNTQGYVIELSQDSLQFNSIQKTYKGVASKDATGYFFVVPDLLEPLTQYSIRIKGTDSIGIPESQWATVAFKTRTEQIFNAVTDANLSTNSAKLTWKATPDVTHITIGANRYDISASEKAAGEKTISGLLNDTEYTATLYFNTRIRGQIKFATLPQLPTGPNVVNVAAGDSLSVLMQNAANGTIFVLRKGTKYSTDNLVNLPEGASFTVWGQTGGAKPIIAFNGINLPANAGTIKFENVDLTGYQEGDASKTKRNYIFNQSAASTTAEIVFENCTIRNFVNTPMRIQGTNNITIGKFSVSKCLVYDIGVNDAGTGSYAFIHTNVASGKINNISITNTTFYKIGYGLILHNAAPSQTVLVKDNTFYNIVGSTRYFIDYNTQAVSSSFVLENNILAKTHSTASPSTARGIRSATAPTVINTYKTTDVQFSANPIANILDYSKASTDLFADPDNGVFTIKDGSFAGSATAGDPRWRP